MQSIKSFDGITVECNDGVITLTQSYRTISFPVELWPCIEEMINDEAYGKPEIKAGCDD